MMLTIRVTAKIAKRLKSPLDQEPPVSTGILGDWYANLLIVKRQHILMLVSYQTLLPLLITGKDLASFPKRFPAALTWMLQTIGIPDEKIKRELSEMENWSLAKTASRQVLGSMNDFGKMLDPYMDDGAPLETQAYRLGNCPCGPLEGDTPIRKTAAFFGEKPPARNSPHEFPWKFPIEKTHI